MNTRVAHTIMAAVLTAGAIVVTTAGPSSAASERNGVCESGEFCYNWETSGHQNEGSWSDHAGSLQNYGSSQPSCYEFRTPNKRGFGQCIKNNAFSVWNRTNRTVRVHYNSYWGGDYDAVGSGARRNLKEALIVENASHRFM